MAQFEYEFWVDRGGTFTDCVLVHAATGQLRTIKILSSDDAPIRALRLLLGLGEGEAIPAVDLRIGTTLGTNALLERRGAEVVLVTDAGLADLVRVRDQARPELFAKRVVRPSPLTSRVVEVGVAIDASGRRRGILDVAGLLEALEGARAAGARVAAIALRFAPLDPDLEVELGALAARAGFDHVVLSHEVAPEPGFLARVETTLVDAYLSPVLFAYFQFLSESLVGSRIRVMRSDGSLAAPQRFRGRDAAISGPAGGLVAAASLVAQRGLESALAFDMGGTSTDVSRAEPIPRTSPEGVVAGLRVRAPMLSVHTIAAGGGSVCRVELGRLIVGPESVGATPGPLCYGHPDGVHVALTDVALALGRIVPRHFPFALDLERSRAGLAREASRFEAGSPLRDATVLAEGFFEVAVSAMARALHDVSTARGHDPRDSALVVFGGAAGQYACAVARRLGIRTLLIHPLAGVFSAYGIGIAPLGASREVALARVELDEAGVRVAGAHARACEPDVRAELEADGAGECALEHLVVMRYASTETTLTLPLREDVVALRHAFETEHRRIFGIVRSATRIELLATRVVGRAARPRVPMQTRSLATVAATTTRLHIGGGWLDVPCVARESLHETGELRGPAIVLEPGGTLVLEPGFAASIDEDGVVVLRDLGAGAPVARSTERDPVRLEVMGHLVASIAERMGHVLEQTATSPNIRDRLDYSCAVFDARGGLVANAPHIPVHLGAMGDSVRDVLAQHGDSLRAGDVYVTNDPARGGSHLPDITVVAPIFDAAGVLRLFVANRGHHADVGGRVPGSMPAFSSTLMEEGVVLRGLRLMRDGRFDDAGIRDALLSGPMPVRCVDDNVHDLEAQVASVRAGESLLAEAFAEHSPQVVEAYVMHLQASAEERVRAALRELPWRGVRHFEDCLDDGTRIAVTLALDDAGSLVVDFTGTAGVHPGNANTPRAVLKSAVLYVLRMLVARPMPLNEGCLRAVTLRIPDPSLVSPPEDAAVASGNVETSQRIVDVLLGAFGITGASQGTMNNVSFGNERFAYYETLGGGAGATAEGAGASAVHTHMTNSRLTDVEVLESCFPVRIVETSIRRGSGGRGEHHGGDGMVREYEMLEPVLLSVVSERRTTAPWGVQGGGPGLSGANYVDGVSMGGRFEVALVAGSRLRIETPGGGAYGSSAVDRSESADSLPAPEVNP